jgi:FixJ family two-component response regulator
MKNTAIKSVIHIVDDDESMRRAVGRLLQAVGYEVRTYASAGEFLIARTHEADGCILLDIRMPGPSGFDLQEALARAGESLPIIFLTAHGDIPLTVRAIKAGASDFLTKPVQRDALLGAVSSALARHAESQAAREKLRHWRACLDRLTEREREVFDRVVSGKLNKQIAGDLGKAERTVKAHRAQIMEKMQVTSVAELVHIADALQASTPDARART